MASIDNEYDYLFKLVILGVSGVGKTSLLYRYTDQTFSDTWNATIGIDFRIKTIELNNERIKLQIWDTAGNQRHKAYLRSYLRQAQGVIIVYDCTYEDSFMNIRNINNSAGEFSYENVRKVIVANKCDRTDKVVEKSRGEELARELQADFFETSAKCDINVDEAFEHLTKEIRNWIHLIGNNAQSLIPKIKQKERKEFCNA